MEGELDRPGQNHRLNDHESRIVTLEGYEHFVSKYDTGWLLNLLNGGVAADWTNVHLGDDNTDPTDNVTHNLGANLADLYVKVMLSTDGTDNNSMEVFPCCQNGTNNCGVTVHQVSTNVIQVQTGAGGVIQVDAAGIVQVRTAIAWYYRIIVRRID